MSMLTTTSFYWNKDASSAFPDWYLVNWFSLTQWIDSGHQHLVNALELLGDLMSLSNVLRLRYPKASDVNISHYIEIVSRKFPCSFLHALKCLHLFRSFMFDSSHKCKIWDDLLYSHSMNYSSFQAFLPSLQTFLLHDFHHHKWTL